MSFSWERSPLAPLLELLPCATATANPRQPRRAPSHSTFTIDLP